MRLGKIAVGVAGVVLSFGCAGGSAQQKPAESSGTSNTPNASASGQRGGERAFRSEKYGYVWTIPEDWEPVSFEEIGITDIHPGLESVAARAKSEDALLMIHVTDVVAVVPGKEPTLRPDSAESYANSWMERMGIKKTGTSRLRVLGTDAIRVDGVLGEPRGAWTRVSLVMFYRNRRRFELRCLGTRLEAGTPCDDAVQGLVIDDMPDSPEPSDKPHVLHLREPKYRLQFDAPDDSWLAIGPRVGGGGMQVVWIWQKEGRQVDVQVLDLAHLGDKIDEAMFVENMAAGERERGHVAVVKRSELSGRPCGHVQINRPDGFQQDMFLQKRGTIVYGLLVTARKRDAQLIARAKAGFKITSSD
jgi:hypothetical protein